MAVKAFGSDCEVLEARHAGSGKIDIVSSFVVQVDEKESELVLGIGLVSVGTDIPVGRGVRAGYFHDIFTHQVLPEGEGKEVRIGVFLLRVLQQPVVSPDKGLAEERSDELE